LAKPTPESRPSLLVTELWGLGDVALAIPFLRGATRHAEVTLVAKPHAAPLLRRFAPEVKLEPFDAPWTRFSGKYRLHRWPWRELGKLRRRLREKAFDLGVSARHDPRDHLLLALASARRRSGYPKAGSALLLEKALPPPAAPHRAEYWNALAAHLGWSSEPPPSRLPAPVRRLAIHPGAAQTVRRWPRDRFEVIGTRLHARGIEVEWLPEHGDLDALLDRLTEADAFIGNDSGPGHLASLLGVPTFTIFGPQRPEAFAPRHPDAAWIEGAPCPYKPCYDACRFPTPQCLLALEVDDVWRRVDAWLATLT